MRIVVNENSQVFSVTYNNGQTKEFPLTKNFQLPQEIDASENPMITVIYAGQGIPVSVSLCDYFDVPDDPPKPNMPIPESPFDSPEEDEYNKEDEEGSLLN